MNQNTDVPSYRGSGNDRPRVVPMPPERMPMLRAGRLLKRWRYVGLYGSELSLCVGAVQLGPLRQSFWAIWDRAAGRLHERTVLWAGGVRLAPGLVEVRHAGAKISLRLDEGPGVEVLTPYGRGYVWTRKQAGVTARGTVAIDGARRECACQAFIDDWAGYPPRRTSWLWSAGLGADVRGRSIAWNLVSGINDAEHASERTLWVDSLPREIGPVTFARDLSEIVFADGATLQFTSEAVRRREEHMVLVHSSYEQPFGRFTGRLPGGIELREAFGVMERHDAVW